MRTVLGTLAALALAAAMIGMGLVVTGVYNVSARSGHFPGVPWLLHTTFNQSVRLRAPSADEVPQDLNHPARVELGELHYLSACAFCHATPGAELSATAQSLEPTPPQVIEAVEGWEPQHLFWIVEEGVKMTGMPHWPARHRGDEVWSVVAYLASLSGSEAQPGSQPQEVTCAACHGEDGRSENPYVPRLDILGDAEIRAALEQYRDGTRPSGFMRQAALNLDDAAIDALAREFGQSALSAEAPIVIDPDEGGAALALRGTRDQPACAACHGPGRDADQPIAPSLAGQSEHYLVAQLKLWREGHRGGGARADLMRKAAQALSDADIAALAAWYASLE